MIVKKPNIIMKVLIFSILICLILISFGFSGYSQTSESEKKIKIGLSHVSESNPFIRDAYALVRAAAKALGDVEVIFLDDEFNPDKQITNIENFVASGVDACAVCNTSEAVIPKLMQITEENEIGFGLFFRQINNQDIKQAAENSPYFIGYTHEDEFNNGYQLGKSIAEKGGKKAVIISWMRGDPVAEERYRGYKKAFDEEGIEILGEQWECTTGDKSAAAVQNFLSAYPELDTVVMVGGAGEPQLGAINALSNAGRSEDTIFATTDFVPNQYEMLESGEVDCISGGHHVDPFFTFMLLYNWASGNPLTASVELADIKVNYIFITSLEMQKEYDTWIAGDELPYNDEEIRSMAVKYNPDMDYQTLLDWAYNYSIEDVMNRHK